MDDATSADSATSATSSAEPTPFPAPPTTHGQEATAAEGTAPATLEATAAPTNPAEASPEATQERGLSGRPLAVVGPEGLAPLAVGPLRPRRFGAGVLLAAVLAFVATDLDGN